MNFRKIVMVCAAILATALSYGQSATLTPMFSKVSGGDVVTLTATATYAGTPGAVGWSITLPDGWSLVATSGPNPPQVAPQEGATGTLEWAYTTVPTDAAVFTFTVKAGSKAGTAVLPGSMLIRAAGKLQTVEVVPANIAVSH